MSRFTDRAVKARSMGKQGFAFNGTTYLFNSVSDCKHIIEACDIALKQSVACLYYGQTRIEFVLNLKKDLTKSLHNT